MARASICCSAVAPLEVLLIVYPALLGTGKADTVDGSMKALKKNGSKTFLKAVEQARRHFEAIADRLDADEGGSRG